ncbi:MAG: hypothetical protein U1F15_09265 [Burkholderiales bacterium]
MKRHVLSLYIPALVLLAVFSGGAGAQRTALPPAEPIVNTRFTPPANVNAIGDIAGCQVVNVSAQPRTIHIELFDILGVIHDDYGSAVYAPGGGNSVGNRTVGFYYCKFTVVDGTRSDIRGSLSICTNAVCKQTVSAE